MVNHPVRAVKNNWGARLGGIAPVLACVPEGALPVRAAFEAVRAGLAGDVESLRGQSRYIFSFEDRTGDVVAMLRRWHRGEYAPSLSAVSVLGIENLGLVLPPEIENGLLVASILGEVEHGGAYHNNLHFRKVLLQAMRMAFVHNRIYAGTDLAFDGRTSGLLMMAACIHDLGHDGKGNYVGGVLVPGRLEKKSFELARPYLEQCGVKPDDLEMVRVMLRCTEVVPLRSASSPINQMKAAYRYHYAGGDNLQFDPDFSILRDDKDLVMLAAVLHEADIATSAGLSYEMTIFESGLFEKENGGGVPSPSDILDFLGEDVCQGQMTTEAGKALYSDNMARIIKDVRKDFDGGNRSYPPLEKSVFLKHSPEHTP